MKHEFACPHCAEVIRVEYPDTQLIIQPPPAAYKQIQGVQYSAPSIGSAWSGTWRVGICIIGFLLLAAVAWGVIAYSLSN